MIYRTSPKDKQEKYDGKNKTVNVMVALLIVLWFIILGFLSFLGSQGVVLIMR